MNRRLLLLLPLLCAALVACGGNRPSNGPALPSPENALYVDVRTPAEFAAGHIRGAINIPHTEIGARISELAAYRSKPVVLYCRSGRRSGLALTVLEEQGFSKAVNGGGLDDLKAQGMPVQ